LIYWIKSTKIFNGGELEDQMRNFQHLMEGTKFEHDFWQLFSLIKNQNVLDTNSLYYKMGAKMSGPIFELLQNTCHSNDHI
jgi:hypothetical protein